MKNEALDAQSPIFWGPGPILEGVEKSTIVYAGRHRRTRGYLATEGRTFRGKDVGRKRRLWQGESVRVESERLAETIRTIIE